MFDLARLASRYGIDLWSYRSEDGRSVKAAFDYALPFRDPKTKWPFPNLERHEDWYWPFLLAQAQAAYDSKEYLEALPAAERKAVGACLYCYRLIIQQKATDKSRIPN